MASDRLIINAAIGGNYLKGQRRLHTSLLLTGYTGDVAFCDAWPVPGYDRSNRYNIKAACFDHVLKTMPHRFLVWMDCTAVAVRSLDPLFERIQERGFYLASSGYKASQTCTDAQLEAAGVTRDQAEGIPDTATGCVGIDMNSDIGTKFLTAWMGWAAGGLFAGLRTHSKQDSADPRFLFGRQDQSAATLIAHMLGMSLDHLGGLTTYWPANSTAVMAYKGIE